MSVITKTVLTSIAVVASATAQAHHSGAMFDMNKCVHVVGTVRAFEFHFPHSWLWVIVPDVNGGTEVWGFESAAPVQMSEVDPRWTREVLRKGDKIAVKFSPMKDGRTGGALAEVTLPNRLVLRAATPACANELPPPRPR